MEVMEVTQVTGPHSSLTDLRENRSLFCVCVSLAVLPILMCSHNGLKIVQTLCKQILLLFCADWHFWGRKQHCGTHVVV